jgi:hypothetical protein
MKENPFSYKAVCACQSAWDISRPQTAFLDVADLYLAGQPDGLRLGGGVSVAVPVGR